MKRTIEEYLNSVPEERRDQVAELHKLIISLYPDATIDFQYKMPTYRAGDGWVAIANQKNYVSLYTCGAHHLEAFKAKHPRLKTGKGCINFKPKDQMPLDDVEQVVKHAMDHPKVQDS